MKRHTRTLLTALVGATALTVYASGPSFALDLPTPYKWDMGPLGNWKVSGGVEAALSGWNNGNPVGGGAAPGVGGGTQGDIDLTNAIFILSNDKFGNLPLSFNAWVGEPPQTPVIGYTSPNVAPNLYSTNGNHGLNNTGAASFLFKGWATLAPLDWLSVQAGRLPSVDGTEIGVGFLNNLPFLSDLNNMQTTVADGGQINFIAGPDKAFYGFIPGYGSTLTVRLADGYKTGHVNELGFTGLWNLTPDGSDFIVAYGHTRLSTVGNASVIANGPGGPGSDHTNPFAVGGFGLWNSDLIGLGTVYNLTNRLSLNAEVETQWLPKSAIPAANRCTTATCGGNTNQDYSRWSTQVTFAYDFGNVHVADEPVRFQWAVQPSYTYQHGNTQDPACNAFGNYLGLDAIPSSGPQGQGANTGVYGTFGCGSKMYAIQTGPTFQYHNAFLRPTLAYTRLASVQPGFAYGNNGTERNQVVVMLDFGFLLGQFEKSDTGQ